MTIYTYIGIIAAAVFTGTWWLVRVLPLMDEREDIWDALDVHLGIPKSYAKLRLRWWWPWGASLRQYTPKGACVWGTVKVPQAQLELIDEGVAEQIRNSSAVYPNWTKCRKISDYSVLVIDPMAINRVTEPGSPAIVVKGNQQAAGSGIGLAWEGSVREDGTYSLPGTAIDTPYIVVPHQAAQGWRFENYWRDSIRNESEHWALAFNNWALRLHYTGANDVHPIFPPVGSSRESGESIRSKGLTTCKTK